MKHYAPNRCLYIKVAKLRTGVGSAEISHLQKLQSQNIYKKSTGGGGSGWGGGGGGQDGCERRIKFFVKIQKTIYFFGRGGGGGSSWVGSGWM